MSEAWTDFIEDFMSLTAGTVSPPSFRLWSAISLVAGACERRVWAQTGQRAIFPNMYTMLVAPPGVGKFIIDDVRDIWTTTLKPDSQQLAFKVAPDNTTKAALVDALAMATQTFLVPNGPPLTYNSLLVAAEEMEVFMPEYDREFIGFLNGMYNNKAIHTENRRHGPNRSIRIENPQLNILAGAQPAYMATRFPEDTWSTGFSRRIIMVYCGEAPFQELFDAPQAPFGMLGGMMRKLGKISQMWGVMDWSREAAEHIALWHRETAAGKKPQGGPPAPTHTKLANYNRSRTVFAVKLALISAIARTGQRVIEMPDVFRGLHWLGEAETRMPDIFREMIGKSDQQVIEEMHYFVMALWAKKRQQPVNGERIMEFLLNRVPAEKAQRIMQVAQQANWIQRVAGTDNSWLPRLRLEAKGVE